MEEFSDISNITADEYTDVQNVFNQMVNDFKENKDKHNLIRIMTNYCQQQSTTPQNIYDLKVKLELEFSSEVKCVYCYTFTPDDYGCDLREIFYNRKNELIEGGQQLLDIFREKKIPEDIWHIMTDIDDTLYPNTEHGTYIAGSDISWTQKEPYPGIKEFYNTFYKTLPENSRYTTILSATPGCLKDGKLKDKNGLLHSILKNYGFIQGPESKYQVTSYIGDIITNCTSRYCGTQNTTNIQSISDLFKLFGNTKFQRFVQYSNIFPEYKILFIGDNGQGDVLAGTQMITANDNCHVFIHKVSEDGINFKKSEEEEQNIQRLNFFKNYYELAQKFQELGILTQSNVNSVKNSIDSKIKLREYSKFANLYNIPNTISNTGGKSRKRIYKYKLNKTKKYKKRKITRKIRKSKHITNKII